MTLVYLNGSLVSDHDAAVSVFDHGVVTGDGVFETVLLRDHTLFALGRHLDRLERSAEAIGLPVGPDRRAELEQASLEVAKRSGISEGKVRITLTSGRGPLGSARGQSGPTVIVAVAPIDPPLEQATLALVPWPRNERGALAGAKTTSYAENAVALAWAHERGASEALFANTRGDLCEGTGSNVFVGIADDQGPARLLTPPISAGCLAGVTRALVLEAGVGTEEDVPMARLGDITEAFLCSTTRGVQPIAAIDGQPLPACPGPLTAEASSRYAALLDSGPEL